MCPDCSLPDCHIACLPTTFGGNPVKSNEILLQCLYQIKETRILFLFEVKAGVSEAILNWHSHSLSLSAEL